MAILASGVGTNALHLIKRAIHLKSKGEFLTVITDNPSAPIKKTLKDFDIPVQVIPFPQEGPFSDRKKSHERALLEILTAQKIDWVFLAGYMRILSLHFLEYFWCPLHKFFQVVNIHPSLLPSFPGKDGFGDAFKAGVKISGITIHLVDSGVDTGPILAQECFYRLPNDTLESFKTRGKLVEFKLYPFVLEQILLGNLKFCSSHGKAFPFFSISKRPSFFSEIKHDRI